MKSVKPLAIAATLALAACTQNAQVAAPAPAPIVAETTPPARLVQQPPPVDAAVLATAERNLRALGYAVGKSADSNDPTLQRAVMAFEKDQGLTEDGLLSPALEERLKQVRATLTRRTAATYHNAIFVYSDGSAKSAGIGIMPPAPAGLVSDTPTDLFRLVRPGSQPSYHLGHRAPGDGFVTVSTVTCHVGRVSEASTIFGDADLLPVDCRMDATHEWHVLYSPMLDTVVEQHGEGKSRLLVAIRPATANWPSAARTGLDWATTHALETPAADIAVPWSSTGVAQRFEIKAFGKISGRDAGLIGKAAAMTCRRFELTEEGRSPMRYPGVACQKGNSQWVLAGTSIALSSPAKAMGAGAAAINLRSAQNR